jgi:hypothetical protein
MCQQASMTTSMKKGFEKDFRAEIKISSIVSSCVQSTWHIIWFDVVEDAYSAWLNLKYHSSNYATSHMGMLM